jgi:dihydroorotate dehydrogenase (NAD+) catalytic subunit
MDLSVTLGRVRLKNPILVASGTFGCAQEMAGFVDLARLGGIIPKTVTRRPQAANAPPRTVETPSGMLNAIGLDNDGIDHFIHHHLPYLRTLSTAIMANIAGENEDEFVTMAEQIGREPGLAALELNLSCPSMAVGQELASLEAHRGPVHCVAFSPDGSVLASGGETPEGAGEVYLWRAAPPDRSPE